MRRTATLVLAMLAIFSLVLSACAAPTQDAAGTSAAPTGGDAAAEATTAATEGPPRQTAPVPLQLPA